MRSLWKSLLLRIDILSVLIKFRRQLYSIQKKKKSLLPHLKIITSL